MGIDFLKDLMLLAILPFLLSCSPPRQAMSMTHHHEFVVAPTNFTRLCKTKEILTVNGQFPGPTLYVNRGDRLTVNVMNHAPHPITIHWHGVLNPRNPWSDGPEYVTMCGIPSGASFTHDLLFTMEEGTIWYHAHSDWTRNTVHGAVVVYPKIGHTYPFPNPYKEYVVVISEWWTTNVTTMLQAMLRTGSNFNRSDAFTINGQPGDQHPCSKAGTARFIFEQGKSYLLRLVNGAMVNGHFFAIANHTLRVVGRDGSYLKPFEREFILITPGQTMDILVQSNQPQNLYYMVASPYIASTTKFSVFYDTTITTAIVEYEGYNTTVNASSIPFPYVPPVTDAQAAYDFVVQEKSLASADHPIDVPVEVDSRFVLTVSMGLIHCPNDSCTGMAGSRLASSINNISFVNPSIDILDAYYRSIKNIYTTDFPSFPPYYFNFTAKSLPHELRFPSIGTRVKVLNYNQTIEVLYQGTTVVDAINHPMHLHGYDFYVVGRGFGNFDPQKDPLSYNLVDPPRENTVTIPYGGWAAMRFRADNPGVWLLHCHFDSHFTWGMSTVFIVKDGPTNDTSMLPPPQQMPKCANSETTDSTRVDNTVDH